MTTDELTTMNAIAAGSTHESNFDVRTVARLCQLELVRRVGVSQPPRWLRLTGSGETLLERTQARDRKLT
jgi:hypothetical protein